MLRARLTLELLANPRWPTRVGRAVGRDGPARPRDDTDDIEPLRITEGCWVDKELAEVTFRIFVPIEGERFTDRAVRAEPLDLNERASASFVGRKVPDGQLPSLSDPREGMGGMTGGFRCRFVRVESSSPLKASSNRRPSASTSSIWCRISCTDSTWSSSGMSFI